MKTAVIFLSIILVVSLGIVIFSFVTNDTLNTQLASEKTINSQLNDTNTKLTNDNIKLRATSNLKSFENVKALDRFLKTSTTIKNVSPDDYASVSCISLMKEAKENGYWMGITAINTTDESIYDAMMRRNRGATGIQWHVFNVAIIGDADLYLVDSQDATSYYRIATISGDFAEYNKDSNASNLNLH